MTFYFFPKTIREKINGGDNNGVFLHDLQGDPFGVKPNELFMDINGGDKNRVFLHDLIKITEGKVSEGTIFMHILLQCCISYCQLVEYGQGDQSGPKLEEISVNFSRQSSWLFKLLTSIKSRQTGSQLAQLLLRIDYNRYFSTYGHDIGIRTTANID